MKDRVVTKPFILSLIFLFVAVFFLYLARNILIPFIVSAFLAYLISPLVDKIMLSGVKRWVAVVIVLVVFLICVAFALSVIVPIVINDINVLSKKIPEYSVYIKEFIAKQKIYFEKIVPFLNKYNLMETLTEESTAFLTAEASKIPQYVGTVISTISIMVLVPVITFFMLLGYDDLPRKLIELIPAKYVELFISSVHEINSVLGGYIRGQIIEVLFIALCAITSLLVIGVNYAILIGVIAGLCNLIPYLGPLIGFILGVSVAAVQFHSIVPVVEVAAAFLIMQQLDNNIVQPIVIGQNVNLGPVTMMFALLAGASIFGVIGMFLAVPALAILKNIFIIAINRYKQTINRG